ncbi:MAG TPA: nuclear transport factor 2 family protein [Pyrinomonadaceae bacterium]|nr:nuclear transport factor 2 family protein [Pyrinomonadaceae bacterium]
MQRLATLFFMLLFVSVVHVQAQDKAPATTPDAELIKQTALDYIEGWYDADAARMERALHPELAKRIVQTDQRGRSNFGHMGAMRLVQLTRVSDGKNIPKEKQQKDVTVFDIFGNAATAKIVAADWIDYLHLAKWNGRWVIVNVLWEMKPKPPAPSSGTP